MDAPVSRTASPPLRPEEQLRARVDPHGPVRRETRVGVNGVRLSYDVVGRGPAVLCIQGAGVAGRAWRPQVAALAPAFRTITFDNRGIGGSSAGAPPLTIETMAADAVAILDAEDVGAAHIIGHSMGGLIALHVAMTRPERVKSLALLCSFADGRDPTRVSWRMAVLGLRCRVGTRTMRRHAMLRMIMPAAYLRQVDRAGLADEVQALFGRDLADQPPIVSEQLHAMSTYSAADRLPAIGNIRTLVVSAAHDPIAPPRLGQAIADGIPGARFVVFPDASHAVTIQCPDDINELLLAHLSPSPPAARSPV